MSPLDDEEMYEVTSALLEGTIGIMQASNALITVLTEVLTTIPQPERQRVSDAMLVVGMSATSVTALMPRIEQLERRHHEE